MIVQVIVDEYSLSKEDEFIIKKIMNLAGIKDYFVTNIRNYTASMDADLYITFGSQLPVKFPTRDINIIKFPAIALLYNKKENEIHRQKAMDLIEAVKTEMLIYTEDDLPRMSSETLINLYNSYIGKIGGVNFTSRNNKLIRIIFNKDDKEYPNTDVRITFYELLALKLADEVFNKEKTKK